MFCYKKNKYDSKSMKEFYNDNLFIRKKIEKKTDLDDVLYKKYIKKICQKHCIMLWQQ